MVLSGTGLVQGFYACIFYESGGLVRCYHSGTNKQTNDEQGKIELLSQWNMDGCFISFKNFERARLNKNLRKYQQLSQIHDCVSRHEYVSTDFHQRNISLNHINSEMGTAMYWE